MDRFWSKVDIKGSDECWEWTASRMQKGYGQIQYEGSQRRAHRVAWMLAKGPIPDGICVLHRCDNPPCVNPKHLFLGTQKDNVADMIAKGRRGPTAGELHGMSNLTDAQVLFIRHWRRARYSRREIAEAFSITVYTVSDITNRRTWKHLP